MSSQSESTYVSVEFLLEFICARAPVSQQTSEGLGCKEILNMVFSTDIKRVLISDNVDSCCKDVLEQNGITVDVKTKLTKDELLSEIQVSFDLNISQAAVDSGVTYFFVRRTMMHLLCVQPPKLLLKLSKRARILKSSGEQALEWTTLIFRQHRIKESLL